MLSICKTQLANKKAVFPLRFASAATGVQSPKEYKLMTATAAGLAVAIPAVYYLGPTACDVLLLLALPPHLALGFKHIVHDYTALDGRVIGYIIAALVFLGILRLMFSKEHPGPTQTILNIWRE